MGLFEKQVSDEQVAAARSKIAAGTSSLRAAAAEIGCAPSTLSVRIKKAEAAEADARVRLGIRDSKPPPPRRRRAGSEPPASGAPEGTLSEGDPVEVLRGALQATKANGQPDWQIRVSAARMLRAHRRGHLRLWRGSSRDRWCGTSCGGSGSCRNGRARRSGPRPDPVELGTDRFPFYAIGMT